MAIRTKTPGYPDLDQDYDVVHQKRYQRTIAMLEFMGAQNTPGACLNLGSAATDPVCTWLRDRGWEVTDTGASDLRTLALGAVQENVFDLMLCLETLEHIKDYPPDEERDTWTGSGIRNTLEFCAKSLKPDGRVLFSTPNVHSGGAFWNWANGGTAHAYEPHPRELPVKVLEPLLQDSFEHLHWHFDVVWNNHNTDPDIINKLRDIVSEEVSARLDKDIIFIVASQPKKRKR